MSDETLVNERIDQLLAEHTPSDTPEFLGAMYDLGLANVSFPEGFGGLGVAPGLQRIVTQRVVAAGGPFPKVSIGLGMGAPTIATHGTDAQKQKWLRPLFSGEEVWCQLFSEPGAGSDVASLSTSALRDGDEWIVNGQKVWTSLAHESRWGMLVARTDPDVPKHRGLTYFICDMHAPGVDVRPLRQMTGQAEFNEVYLTDVRIPDAHRIGDVGDGWRISLTTLMNERVAIGGGSFSRKGPIDWALELYREHGNGNPVQRDEVVKMWIQAEVLRLTVRRAAAAMNVGTPGPEGSVAKLLSAEHNKACFSLCVNLAGPEGVLYPTGYAMDRSRGAYGYKTAQEWFLRARANSIEGGTSEVMRNILGERVLGLPGDVRVDKELPWREVPRS
ncbi:MAG: acyl-CoA dehydrogenase family protein [Acidimicrobiia bacterium]|jgi:alkylation response protein AidB-like acyl-CoA dehydrogenase